MNDHFHTLVLAFIYSYIEIKIEKLFDRKFTTILPALQRTTFKCHKQNRTPQCISFAHTLNSTLRNESESNINNTVSFSVCVSIKNECLILIFQQSATAHLVYCI